MSGRLLGGEGGTEESGVKKEPKSFLFPIYILCTTFVVADNSVKN